MVFVPTTNVGREVQQALRGAGCDLPLYHGKLPANEREVLLGRFSGRLDPPLNAVICTSAFSMALTCPTCEQSSTGNTRRRSRTTCRSSAAPAVTVIADPHTQPSSKADGEQLACGRHKREGTADSGR